MRGSVSGRSGSDPWIGHVIDGRYAVGQPVGNGTTSNVYRAYQLSLGREVAIKVCSPWPATAPGAAARFDNEARILGLIAQHPNATSVFDVGVTGAGAPYLVTELVKGRTLEETLSREGSLPVERAIRIASDVCTLLIAAHTYGIVHRDLKPANVMLAPAAGGELVKVIDFGMSTLRGGQVVGRATRPHGLRGTPVYMAPEAIAGDQVESPSDLYSLGVVLYQMLAGRPPYTGTVADVLAGHLYEPPPPLAAPAEVAETVAWLLRRDPAARPTAAQAGPVLARLARAAR